MPGIRVLLADDHTLFRQGLRQICEIKGGFQVVGEAQNGRDTVQMSGELEPDVILMDINMPELSGIEATSRIMQSEPKTRIIVLTMYHQDHFIFDAIKAGARGYLLKSADAQDLVDAVRRVHQGEALVDPHLAIKVLDEFRRLSQNADVTLTLEELTEGEMAVLRLVAEGDDNQSIAEQLHLSVHTVSNRLRIIYEKLQVNNRTQAALYALRRGWATLDADEDQVDKHAR